MGEILIAGMASLLICIFLGPKFIDFLREKEFGQHIREEGPEGHHEKAGTPTMGGLVIFLAVSVPFLILTDYRAVSLAVFGTAVAMMALGFFDDWAKITNKRSLGVSGRNKLLFQALGGDRALALPRRVRGLRRQPAPARGRRDGGGPRPRLPAADLPGDRGRHERGEPDRRPGRPGRRLRRDRAAGLHRDDLHHLRPAGPGPAVRVPRRRLRGLPLVQLVPGGGVHGRHGLARVGRGHRRRWR